MTPAELRAQFSEAAEAEAERGYRMYQLVPESDVALALRALVGNDLINIVRARLAREQAEGNVGERNVRVASNPCK
jgi:hypothetical protein